MNSTRVDARVHARRPQVRTPALARAGRVAVAGLVFLVSACATAPVTRIALPAASHASLDPPLGGGTTVRVRHLSLPAYLDGAAVVIRRDENRLEAARRTQWAERPSVGALRVLRDALAQRLGPGRVLIPGDGRAPDADLTLEFLSLDPWADGLHLDARWALACVGGEAHEGRVRLLVAFDGSTPHKVAAATSEALSRLAGELAPAMRCERHSDDASTTAYAAAATWLLNAPGAR